MIWVRLRCALQLPPRDRWKKTAFAVAVGATAVAVSAQLSGLVEWQPEPANLAMAQMAFVLFVAPALLEEVLFRGVLHPAYEAYEDSVRFPKMLLAAALFVLWHPLQYWTGLGPPWSVVFVSPAFLVTVTVAALALGIVREFSGSIWPAVAFHWAMICAWKFSFGGPF